MKKYILFITAALLVAACQESVEERAAKEARTYTTKNCPAKLGENIMIDSMAYEASTRTLHYYYTLMGNADSVGVLSTEEARSSMLHDLKNTTSMAVYKEAGFNFAYTYRSQKNPENIIFDILLTPKDYQ
jgi:PBP1b-binding outer membrane lipoprotein LpoB